MKYLKNKIKLNGEEYQFAIDSMPIENSSNPITSGAVFNLLQNISQLIGLKTVTIPTMNSNDLITSGGVYKYFVENLKDKASFNPGSLHLQTPIRQNVIYNFKESFTRPESGKSVAINTISEYDQLMKNLVNCTYFDKTDNNFIYIKSRVESGNKVTYTYFIEEPQINVLYYDLTNNTLCYWNGSTLVNIK